MLGRTITLVVSALLLMQCVGRDDRGAQTSGRLTKMTLAEVCVAEAGDSQCFDLTAESEIASDIVVGDDVRIRWKAPGTVIAVEHLGT